MTEIDWKECVKELPPCNGKYYICHLPTYFDGRFGFYDGFGFRIEEDKENHYIGVNYWSRIPMEEKRYGKIEDMEYVYRCYEYEGKDHSYTYHGEVHSCEEAKKWMNNQQLYRMIIKIRNKEK